jgi:CheY-like chemotaxis protein
MEGYRRPLAIVVEDDDNQRALLSTLLEECEMEVLECDSV